MSDLQTFGSLVREKRDALGLTQRALAGQLQVDHTNLSKIENGQLVVSEDLIVRIARALGIDPDYALACAGKVASDVIEAIAKRPDLVRRIRAEAV